MERESHQPQLDLTIRHRQNGKLSDQVATSTGNGWYLLRQVRESGQAVPVILLSSPLQQCPSGFPAGLAFDAVLCKPVLPESLLAVIWMQVLKIDVGRTARSGLTALRWQELANLASDGDVSGIEDWLARLDVITKGDERVAIWVRDALNRLDMRLLEILAIKAKGADLEKSRDDACRNQPCHGKSSRR